MHYFCQQLQRKYTTILQHKVFLLYKFCRKVESQRNLYTTQSIMNDTERIKALLKHLGISGKKLADSLGLERADRIYNIQNGRNHLSPAMATSIHAKYPEINIAWLLTGQGAMIKEKETENEKEKPNGGCPSYNEIAMIPLVQQYAYAGYLMGYEDQIYIEDLPKIPFVIDRQTKGEYLCFEVKGDSMDDGSKYSYEDGDLVLAREIDPYFWTSRLNFKDHNTFIIVHKTEGIVIKEIVDHDVPNGIITLHSYNPFYRDRTVYLGEVDKLFKVVITQRKR